MTTIPFAEALELLARAFDINAPGYSNVVSFSLDTSEGAASFLELSLEDENHEFFFQFLASANATVKVDGDRMMLVYDYAEAGDIPPTIGIRLMMPQALEPAMGAVHKHQCELESSINRILETCQSASADVPFIARNAKAAKQAFDWLDNFTVIRASQPKAAAEARPPQDAGKDGTNDLEGRAGNELAEQPVKEGEDQNGQECGEQHAAPYQPEVDTAADSFATPPIILQALKHVRSRNPEVDRVVFWGDGRWSFMTDSLSSPPFMGLIDIGLLEDAASEVADGYPHAFQLPSEEE